MGLLFAPIISVFARMFCIIKGLTEEGYVVTDGNSGSYLRLTPALREKIDEELTRGLVEEFVARAKANRLSYKKVIALVSELWDDEA